LPRLPQVNARETLSALIKGGFVVWSQSGGHTVLINHRTRRRTVVAEHGSRDIPAGTVYAILKQAGLSVEEFIELLK
jgi:predicted RNA binding protein YcfA (HicA-like mRNA interferase family)